MILVERESLQRKRRRETIKVVDLERGKWIGGGALPPEIHLRLVLLHHQAAAVVAAVVKVKMIAAKGNGARLHGGAQGGGTNVLVDGQNDENKVIHRHLRLLVAHHLTVTAILLVVVLVLVKSLEAKIKTVINQQKRRWPMKMKTLRLMICMHGNQPRTVMPLLQPLRKLLRTSPKHWTVTCLWTKTTCARHKTLRRRCKAKHMVMMTQILTIRMLVLSLLHKAYLMLAPTRLKQLHQRHMVERYFPGRERPWLPLCNKIFVFLVVVKLDIRLEILITSKSPGLSCLGLDMRA